MKISGEHNNIQSVNAVNDEPLVTVKNFNMLAAGDKFAAKILDIQINKITIALASGQSLTAKSQVLPDARIGEETFFSVKENLNGQIVLEMLKAGEEKLQTGIIKEALKNAGMFATNENINIVRSLINSQLPIDQSTIQKAAFFNYAQKGLPIDGILFLIKENFQATVKNVDTLNGIINRDFLMDKSLNELEELISKIEDKSLRAEISELVKPLQKKLHLKITDGKSLENISELYKEIDEKANEIMLKQKSLSSFSDTNTRGVFEKAENISDNIQFMNQINNYKNYIQIPFSVKGNENNAELTIFKGNKKNKNSNENISALIALEYEEIGRVEVFVNKFSMNLSFQFRAEQDGTLKLVSQNFAKLSQILVEKGFKIANFQFKKMSEPFKLTDEMPSQNKEQTKTNKRYSFDMRV